MKTPDYNLLISLLGGVSRHRMDTTIIDDIYRVEPGLRIWRVCHAGFLVKHQDVVIILDPAMEVLNPTDPYVSEHSEGLRLVKRLPFLARDLKTVDLVLVSHADEDHFTT